MLEHFSINLFIFAILAAVGMVGAALLRQVRIVVTRNAVAKLESRNDKLRRKQDNLERQHRETQERIRTTEDERRMLHGQIQEIRRRIKQMETENFELIHELGEPGGTKRLFMGVLHLGYTITIARTMTTESKLRGVRHTLEIWAEDVADAARMAKLAFPADNGFTVQDVRVAGSGGKTGTVPQVAAQ